MWNGKFVSYFDIGCSQRIETTLPPGLDESQQDARHRRVAIRYVEDHLGEVPRIVLARVGAIVGLYQPEYQITLDGVFEGRGHALGADRDVLVLRAGAAVGRRARSRSGGGARCPVFPLLVPPVMVARSP